MGEGTYLVILTLARHLRSPVGGQALALRQVTDGGPAGDGEGHQNLQQEHPRNTRHLHLGSGEACIQQDS